MLASTSMLTDAEAVAATAAEDRKNRTLTIMYVSWKIIELQQKRWFEVKREGEFSANLFGTVKISRRLTVKSKMPCRPCTCHSLPPKHTATSPLHFWSVIWLEEVANKMLLVVCVSLPRNFHTHNTISIIFRSRWRTWNSAARGTQFTVLVSLLFALFIHIS